MTSYTNPNHALAARMFAVVSVSVSTETSAKAAGVGPFRGLFVITSASFTITGQNNNTMVIDNLAKNTTLWIEGSFISAIATATSIFMLN